MVFIKKDKLPWIFGAAALFCIPFVGPALGLTAEEFNEELMARYVPFILLGEILIYLVFGFLSGAVDSPWKLIVYAVFLSFFRFFICLVGGVVLNAVSEEPLGWCILYLWMGNVVVALIHVVFMMMAGPHLAAALQPGFLTDRAERSLYPEEELSADRLGRRLHSESAPVGGFVRVYDFKELGRLLSNMIGIEGYVLYTWEGLVLWKDFRLQLDVEKLVVSYQTEYESLKKSQMKAGFRNPDKFITQTSEHNFIHVAFNELFYGVLVFKNDADMGDVLARLKYLERSAGELLEMRYSPLV